MIIRSTGGNCQVKFFTNEFVPIIIKNLIKIDSAPALCYIRAEPFLEFERLDSIEKPSFVQRKKMSIHG